MGSLPGEAGAPCSTPVRDFASPCHLSAAAPIPPQPVGSSITLERQLGSYTVVAPTTGTRLLTGPTADSVVGNKVGVMARIRRVAEKRKIV